MHIEGMDLKWDNRRNNGMGGWMFYPHVDEEAAHKAQLDNFSAGLHAKDRTNEH